MQRVNHEEGLYFKRWYHLRFLDALKYRLKWFDWLENAPALMVAGCLATSLVGRGGGVRRVLRGGREHCGCRQTDWLGKYLAKFPYKQIRAKKRRRRPPERRQSTGVFSGPDNSPVIDGGNKALYFQHSLPPEQEGGQRVRADFLRKVQSFVIWKLTRT